MQGPKRIVKLWYVGYNRFVCVLGIIDRGITLSNSHHWHCIIGDKKMRLVCSPGWKVKAIVDSLGRHLISKTVINQLMKRAGYRGLHLDSTFSCLFT